MTGTGHADAAEGAGSDAALRKEEQLRRFREIREAFQDAFRQQAERGGDVRTSTEARREPREARDPAAAAALTPVLIGDLKEGEVHSGRVLLGSVAEQPFFTGSSAAFLLEDPGGELVRVTVYGIPGMDWDTAQATFPLGRRLRILEPFFKMAADGETVVRVDDPGDVEDWAPGAPAAVGGSTAG